MLKLLMTLPRETERIVNVRSCKHLEFSVVKAKRVNSGEFAGELHVFSVFDSETLINKFFKKESMLTSRY